MTRATINDKVSVNKQDADQSEPEDVLKLTDVLIYKDWLSKNKNLDLVFFGFSFGYADSDIITELLKNYQFNSVTIYYYTLKDKKSIIKNLFEIFGDEYTQELLSGQKGRFEFRKSELVTRK